MNRWLWLTILIVLLAVALAAWSMCGNGVPVTVAAVQARTVRAYVDERGVTRVPQRYEITMPFDGRAERTELEEGDRVYAGQVVARLVGKDIELDVKLSEAIAERLRASLAVNADVSLETTGSNQAEIMVRSMAANLLASEKQVEMAQVWKDYWKKQVERLRTLVQGIAVTEEEVERSAANLQAAEAEFVQRQQNAAAQSLTYEAMRLVPQLITDYLHRKKLEGDVLRKQLQEASVQLDQALLRRTRAVMTSPIDGIVLSRANESEQFLGAGTPLLILGRLDQLEFEADVLTQEAAKIRPGSPAEIYGPTVGREAGGGYRGQVRRVYPDAFTKISSLGVEEQRVKVVVAVDDIQSLLQDRPSLGVGFRVRLRIFTDLREDVLAVPRSALFRNSQGRWAVFVVTSGRAYERHVEVGLSNEQEAEITAGLESGDVIVLAPESALDDGMKVKTSRLPAQVASRP
jgi:HlyD family secretion protein